MSDQITRRVLIDQGLQSLDVRVQEVMEAFAEMLCLVGRSDLARHLPWLDPSKLDLEEGNQAEDLDPEDMAQLYSIAFQLLDMVEERVAMNIRRERERTFGASAERGLWSERLQSLKDLGVSESDIAAAIPTIEIEPVFTAHPTEAKRASVRERHRVIYQLLLKLEYDHYTSIERDLIHGRLLSALEALWFTGETHLERPTVKRELRNTLFYLREMFPDVVARLDQHLIKSWEQVGFDPQSLQQVGGGSRTRFGIWIGGDRDGHPFVTAEVTADTLALLRQQSLKLYRRELSRAAEHLTVSLDLQPVPKKLASAKKDLVKYLGKSGKLISKRHREEPWRAFCHLLGEWVVQDEEATPEKLREYIELIEDSLSEVGCVRLGAQFIQPLKRMLDVFGFHLASLDIRQNSAFHDTAAEEILVAAGVEEGATFSQWSEEKRVAFLTESLESASPLLPESSSKKIGSEAESIGEKADAVRDCYKVLATHWENYSDGLGSLIVSMTRQLSDLLLVHFFAREFGLVVNAKGGGGQLPTCPLQVVPLLETLGDLDGGAEIVSAYLRHPVAQRSLAQQSASSDIVQQVMLGYSDSNKDAGILASQVGLHRAQDEIYAAGQAEGVEIRFFHGRGGTVSRGAGPVQWFVNSLPKGSLHRGLRMTEQGETIATKYTHLASATYNLELLQACSLHAGVVQKHNLAKEDKGIELLEPLAVLSEAAYREFIEKDGFISFYRQATPIDALEQTQMGSRPARRTGTASLDDLRAIPWVFSWTQARFYLPGWYGVGSALEKMQREDSKAYAALLEGSRDSIFARYVLTNVESSLASSSLELMHAYAGLVDDEKLRDDFMTLIENEHKLTQKHLEAIFERPLLDRRPRFAKALALRAEPLHKLHCEQIKLLKKWRDQGGELPDELLYTINATSSGLRTTG